jgi:hypothetical protein
MSKLGHDAIQYLPDGLKETSTGIMLILSMRKK